MELPEGAKCFTRHSSLVTRHSSLIVLAALGIVYVPPIFAQRFVGVDPENVGWSAAIEEGSLTGVVQRNIPAEAFSKHVIDAPKGNPEQLASPRPKIHPELLSTMESRAPSELLEMVVVFEEDTPIPPMANLDVTLPRSAPENASRLREIDAAINTVRNARSLKQTEKRAMLGRDFGGRVIDCFWLINGMVVELPLSAVNGLAQRPDVLSIEPRQKAVPPPGHGTANHVSNARAQIDTDWYFNQNLTGGFIGLLDTGVRSTHSLLTGPDHIDIERDCTGGDTNGICNALPNPQDDFWNHGVSSAAILTGNGNMNNPFRGATAITVDSLKIYTAAGLDTAAAVNAFQYSVAIGNRVIVAEIQDTTGHNGAISLSADAAFDSNRVVIAAAGNYGPAAGTVSAPGNAHKALAIGGYDVVSTNLLAVSGRGPTSDSRFKPDVTLPTNTLTASRISDTATQVFVNTSGATPYGAAAAMLYSNWYSQYGVFDAGHLYALMIAAGGNTATNTAFDNSLGAGRLKTLYNGYLNIWKISVGSEHTWSLTFTVNTPRKKLKAAIWWPETSAQSHNDIDLSLLNPSGSQVAFSNSLGGVFEKVNAISSTALPQGTWKVRVRGVSVPTAPQTVYAVVFQE